MDHDLAWWVGVVFEAWRARPGPQYQRLSAAVLDAIETGALRPGSQLPAERVLADALGVSRGTIVAAVNQLVAAGVARRRQGAGTFVAGRPSWLGETPTNPAAALLMRRLAAGSSLDLSLSTPPSLAHVPEVAWTGAAPPPSGHGLDPVGLLELREQVAMHLSEHQQLPTTPEQLVITAGAQQALSLVVSIAGRRATVIAGCPTYPGLMSAMSGHRTKLSTVDGDGAAGIDTDAVARRARSVDSAVVYVMPTGSNPTGSVLPLARRRALLAGTRAPRALVVEDLTLADLVYAADVPPPLGAMDPSVVSVGSVSKVLWAGLRVGWIRANEPTRGALLRAKAAADLGTSVPAQTLAARLLGAVDEAWLRDLRAALAKRRNHLMARLDQRLPSWAIDRPPDAGLSLWARLPVHDADAFAHVAAAHGVVVAPGSVMCACGRHRGSVRMSFAHPIEDLDIAAERLASAWEAHCEDIAAIPGSR